jgi:hypothetical protein
MDEPENQMENNAPVSAAPPVQPQDVPVEPAKMSWLQRFFGVLISPGETFTDVNRKPTILAPLIILIVIVLSSVAFTNWKMGPYMDDFLRAQIKQRAESSGQTLTDEQMAQQFDIAKTINKFTPLIAAVFAPIIYLAIAGLFALGMMMIQAKTTFKKVYSVTLWTFAGLGLISTIVFMASMMVKDEESLRGVNIQNPTASVPTNVGVFLDPQTSPMIRSLAGSLDIFSIWTICLLSIGLAAIAGSKKIKTGNTATVVVVLWLIYVAGKTVLSPFTGG